MSPLFWSFSLAFCAFFLPASPPSSFTSASPDFVCSPFTTPSHSEPGCHTRAHTHTRPADPESASVVLQVSLGSGSCLISRRLQIPGCLATPRDLLENKEPSLGGGGAVHLLSDARRRERGLAESRRTRPLAPRAGRSRAGRRARGWPPPRPGSRSRPGVPGSPRLRLPMLAKAGGRRPARAALPQVPPPRPSRQCPGSKS
ncbi:transmembrane protein 253 isoform X2 [Mesocricetus auratus]|uniref:Transmembrane protein 253 isoform X2 n=1 Tax=Mesocricetus auratus TaxID=10036 RepID=A0ABM2WTP8_MESAU|nr:transmembrane protein 253 isoform X2 [Mesocricetus auratus]